MKTMEKISEGKNYSAINIGSLDELMEHSYLHPKLKMEVKGKVFVGDALRTTGSEISFQILPPNAVIPFLHKHNTHEEVYVFLKGKGQFQVDEDVFDIQEGSVIRISPQGSRSWRNNSDGTMVFMVIQSRDGSLSDHFVDDGYRVEGELAWK